MRNTRAIKRYLSIPKGQYPWINMNIIMRKKSAKLTPSKYRRKENGIIYCQAPHSPPPYNLLFSNDNNGIRELIKMLKLCAAYMKQDATDETRNKMRLYTDEHFAKTKMFIEQVPYCKLPPEDRPTLKRAVQYAQNNDAPIITLNVRQTAKGKLESLVWLQQQSFDFRIIEMPSLTRANLHHAVAFASDDIQVIAGKTRAALQQIKADMADGKAHISHAGNMISKLGAPDPSIANKSKSAKVLERTMSLYYSHLKDMRAEGLSFAAMADRLNRLGISPPFNTVFDQELQEYITFKPSDAEYKIWHSTSVRNYFFRGELNAEKNKTRTPDEKGSG